MPSDKVPVHGKETRRRGRTSKIRRSRAFFPLSENVASDARSPRQPSGGVKPSRFVRPGTPYRTLKVSAPSMATGGTMTEGKTEEAPRLKREGSVTLGAAGRAFYRVSSKWDTQKVKIPLGERTSASSSPSRRVAMNGSAAPRSQTQDGRYPPPHTGEATTTFPFVESVSAYTKNKRDVGLTRRKAREQPTRSASFCGRAATGSTSPRVPWIWDVKDVECRRPIYRFPTASDADLPSPSGYEDFRSATPVSSSRSLFGSLDSTRRVDSSAQKRYGCAFEGGHGCLVDNGVALFKRDQAVRSRAQLRAAVAVARAESGARSWARMSGAGRKWRQGHEGEGEAHTGYFNAGESPTRKPDAESLSSLTTDAAETEISPPVRETKGKKNADRENERVVVESMSARGVNTSQELVIEETRMPGGFSPSLGRFYIEAVTGPLLRQPPQSRAHSCENSPSTSPSIIADGVIADKETPRSPGVAVPRDGSASVIGLKRWWRSSLRWFWTTTEEEDDAAIVAEKAAVETPRSSPQNPSATRVHSMPSSLRGRNQSSPVIARPGMGVTSKHHVPFDYGIGIMRCICSQDKNEDKTTEADEVDEGKDEEGVEISCDDFTLPPNVAFGLLAGGVWQSSVSEDSATEGARRGDGGGQDAPESPFESSSWTRSSQDDDWSCSSLSSVSSVSSKFSSASAAAAKAATAAEVAASAAEAAAERAAEAKVAAAAAAASLARARIAREWSRSSLTARSGPLSQQAGPGRFR